MASITAVRRVKVYAKRKYNPPSNPQPPAVSTCLPSSALRYGPGLPAPVLALRPGKIEPTILSTYPETAAPQHVHWTAAYRPRRREREV